MSNRQRPPNSRNSLRDDPYLQHPPTVGPVLRAEILRPALQTPSQQNARGRPPNLPRPQPIRRIQRPMVSKSSPINMTQRSTPRKDATVDRREVLSFRSVSRKIVRSPEKVVYAVEVSDTEDEKWTPARKPLFELGPLGRARKRPNWRDASSSTPNSSSDGESTGTESDAPATANARSDNGDPPPELLGAIERLTLTMFRLQLSHRLPFLRRNLRRSMKFHGIKTRPRVPGVEPSQLQKTKVTYVLAGQENTRWEGHMFGYKCPACELFDGYVDRGSLEAHLRRWHTNVKVRWKKETDGERLIVLVPDVPESESEEEEEEVDELLPSSPSRSPSPTPVPVLAEPARPSVSRSSTVAVESALRLSPTPETKPPIHLLGVKLEGEGDRARTVPPGSRLGIPMTPEPDRLVTPTPTPTLSSSVAPSTNSSEYTSTLGSVTPAPTITPVPPKPVYYSARPSGPKPYDIFNTLPLEPYGILAWQVIDREEDLFEVDDVRDEDKVVTACWGRWIVLNKYRFTIDYFEGVKSFVKEWWQVIKEAADFDALRVFLLMLASYDFLTGDELCKILQMYSELAGMDDSELGLGQ